MRFPKPLLMVTLLVGGLVAAGWYALCQMHASLVYGVHLEFASLPENDLQFVEWMRSQPGVVPNTVHVARQRKSVDVSWIMTQTLCRREPPVPDFLAAFEWFGYAGAVHIRYGTESLGE